MNEYEIDEIESTVYNHTARAWPGSATNGQPWRFGTMVQEPTIGAKNLSTVGLGNSPNKWAEGKAEAFIETAHVVPNPADLGYPGDEWGGYKSAEISPVRAGPTICNFPAAEAVSEINHGGNASAPAVDHLGDPGDEWHDIELGNGTSISSLRKKWLIGVTSRKWDLVKTSAAAVTRFWKVDSGEASTTHVGIDPPATTAVSNSRAMNTTQLVANDDLNFLSFFFETLKDCVSSCCGLRRKKTTPNLVADPGPLPEFVINMNQPGYQATTPEVSIFISAMLDTIRKTSFVDPGMVRMAPRARFSAMPTPTPTEPGSTLMNLKTYAFPFGGPSSASRLKSRDLPTKETIAIEDCTAKESHNATICAPDGTPSPYYPPPVAVASYSSAAALMFPADNSLPSENTEAEKFLYAAFSEESDGSGYDSDSQVPATFTVTLPTPTNPVITYHKHTAHSSGTIIENTQLFAVTNKGFVNVENVILGTHQTTFEGAEVGKETHQLVRQVNETEMTNNCNLMEDESAAEQSRIDSDDDYPAGEPPVYNNINMMPLPSRPFRYSSTSTTFIPWTGEQLAEYISTVTHLESLCNFFDTAAAECDDDEVTNTNQEPKTCLAIQNLLTLNTPRPPVPQVRISEMFEDLLRLFEPGGIEDGFVNMGSEDLYNGDKDGVEQDEDEDEEHKEHEATTPTATESNTTGPPAIEVTVAEVTE